MPQLPVTCPRCGADLTVGREHLNRPVECGACGRPFVPVADPGGREPDDLPARKKKGEGGPVFGILSLILGVGGVVTCCCGTVPVVMGGGAILTGLIGLRNRDGRGLAVAGLVLGLIAVGLRVAAAATGVVRNGFDDFDLF